MYYPQKELKHFGLEIFSHIRDISTENHKQRLVTIFCAKLFYVLLSIHFGTNVPNNQTKRN